VKLGDWWESHLPRLLEEGFELQPNITIKITILLGWRSHGRWPSDST
jgi:hypothetical protein